MSVQCPDSLIYSYTELRPVSLTGELEEGVDYEVRYVNNINVGTSEYTIAGLGNYTGEIAGTFVILPIDIGKLSLVECPESLVYSWMPVEPVLLPDTLVLGVDYTVEYHNNTDKGTATYTVTGHANYTGLVEGSFLITPVALEEEDIVLTGSDTLVYNGNKQNIAFTVEKFGRTLVRYEDYAVTVSDNKDVGTAFVSILGLGNYTGVVIKQFVITPIDISAEDITLELSEDSLLYDGKAKTPSLSVYLQEMKLEEGVDYVVIGYVDNIHAGIAKIVIEGKGNYSGFASQTFVILKAGLTVIAPDVEVEYGLEADLKPVVYNGLVVEDDESHIHKGKILCDYSTGMPAGSEVPIFLSGFEADDYDIAYVEGLLTVTKAPLIVRPQDMTVECGQDISSYEIEYDGLRSGDTNVAVTDVVIHCEYDSNDCAKGEYSIDILSANSDNYLLTFQSGLLTVAIQDIPEDSIVSLQIKLLDKSIFNAQLQKPRIELSLGQEVLIENEDYEVSYGNNFNATTQENLATIFVKGIGQYAYIDTVQYFEIEQYEFTKDDLSLDGANFSYTGEPLIPSVMVACSNGMTPVLGEDYEIEVINNISHSDSVAPTVILRGIGNCKGTVLQEFSIEPLVITANMITLTPSACLYDGTPKTPAVSIKLDTLNLQENVDYDLLYYNNIDVGTAYVVVVGKGNCTGTSKVEYQISQYNFLEKHISLSPSGFAYDGTAHQPKVMIVNDFGKLQEGKDFTVRYVDNVNAGTAYAIISGLGLYADNEVISKPFLISPAQLAGSFLLEYTTTVYDGTSKQPAVIQADGSATFVVRYEDNCRDAGQHSVEIIGTGNYSGSRVLTYIVEKAQVAVHTDDVTITDKDSVPVFNIVYDGIVEGDTLDAYSFVVYDTSAVGTVGTYLLKLTPSQSNNYVFSYSVATLRVIPSEIEDNNFSIKVVDNEIYVAGTGKTYDYFLYDLKGVILQSGSNAKGDPISLSGIGHGLFILRIGKKSSLITVK